MSITCVPTASSSAGRLVCKLRTQQLWNTRACSDLKLFSADAGTNHRSEENHSLPLGRCIIGVKRRWKERTTIATQQPPIPQSGRPDVPHGRDLLNRPVLNKGTAFTEDERSKFGLYGLLPPHVESLDEQIVRAYEAYKRQDDDLERHLYLRALQDTNEVLFYRLLLDHIEEMTPSVYTPVVALACQRFSHIY